MEDSSPNIPTDQQHQNVHCERSPLLLSSSSTCSENEVGGSNEFHRAPKTGNANAVQVVLNQMKTCLGTGVLTLPFAAKEAGLILFVLGLVGIALWNVYASRRLCDCYDLIEAEARAGKRFRNQPPPPGTATLGSVAWYALGPAGLFLLDSVTVMLLLGILVAYNDAIRTFIQSTPFHTGNSVLDAIVIACMIAPLSIVPDMSYLSKTSAAGLSVLAGAMLVIAGYGFGNFVTNADFSVIHLLPNNGLEGASNWFGCTVFGFGIVPLTFNYRESMAEPKQFTVTTLIAMLSVALSYIVTGITLLLFYPTVEADVLSEIPESGYLPTATRLALVAVTMATAPLLVVPCAELLEGKLLGDDDHHQAKVMIRFGICFLTVGIAILIPSFVSVIAIVGCLSVAFVSFCIPPMLHLILVLPNAGKFSFSSARMQGGGTSSTPFNFTILFDAFMLVWGIAATVISTTLVVQSTLSGDTK